MVGAPAVVLGSLSLVRALTRARIPCVVAATDRREPLLRSRHARRLQLLPGLSGEHAESSRDLLIALGRRLAREGGGRVPLLYDSDPALGFLYRYRDELSAEFLVLLNEAATAEALLHKDRFAALCAARGVRVPRTFSSAAELEAAAGTLTGPVIVKPHHKAERDAPVVQLFGGRKALVFPDRRALFAHPAYRACRDAVVVQERIPGAEDRLYSFHGFATEDGELLAWFVGRKVRTYPRVTGDSSLIELAVDDRVASHGMQVAAALGLRGVFKIDLIEDERSGVLYTLEVNARFNLWHQLGAIHGINLPALACAYLRDGTVPPPVRYRPRWRWLHLYRDYKSFQQSRQLGELGVVGWLSSLAQAPAVFESFAWRDPAPAAYSLAGLVRGRVRRWRATAS